MGGQGYLGDFRGLSSSSFPSSKVLVIHDAGAHGHSMGFNYNGKPRSAEYLYRLARGFRRTPPVHPPFRRTFPDHLRREKDTTGTCCSYMGSQRPLSGPRAIDKTARGGKPVPGIGSRDPGGCVMNKLMTSEVWGRGRGAS